MDTGQSPWTLAIVRVVAVAGLTIGLGAALYGWWVFTPTMKPFQFLLSGVSIALMYAGLKGGELRNGLAALFIWFLVLVFVISKPHSWLFILSLTYIGGMAAAIALHQKAVMSPLAHNVLVRIALAGAIVSIANGVIILVLGIVSWKAMVEHADTFLDTLFFNVKIGALIGVAAGGGMEVVEFVIRKFIITHGDAQESPDGEANQPEP